MPDEQLGQLTLHPFEQAKRTIVKHAALILDPSVYRAHDRHVKLPLDAIRQVEDDKPISGGLAMA